MLNCALRPAVVRFLVLVAMATCACGVNDEPPLTRSEFIEAADGICARLNADLARSATDIEPNQILVAYADTAREVAQLATQSEHAEERLLMEKVDRTLRQLAESELDINDQQSLQELALEVRAAGYEVCGW